MARAIFKMKTMKYFKYPTMQLQYGSFLGLRAFLNISSVEIGVESFILMIEHILVSILFDLTRGGRQCDGNPGE